TVLDVGEDVNVNGEFAATGGALIDIGGSLIAAGDAVRNGDLNFAGADTEVFVGEKIDLSGAQLKVDDGARLVTGEFSAAQSVLSAGSIAVSGPGSSYVQLGAGLLVGEGGTGRLDISDSGSVLLESDLSTGGSNGDGFIDVSGGSSELRVNGTVTVGQPSGNGVLAVADGATAEAYQVELQSGFGNASLDVDGIGSKMIISSGGDLNVAANDFTFGDANATGGGKILVSDDLRIGGGQGSVGVVRAGSGGVIEVFGTTFLDGDILNSRSGEDGGEIILNAGGGLISANSVRLRSDGTLFVENGGLLAADRLWFEGGILDTAGSSAVLTNRFVALPDTFTFRGDLTLGVQVVESTTLASTHTVETDQTLNVGGDLRVGFNLASTLRVEGMGRINVDGDAQVGAEGGFGVGDVF
ncbi:MAG: hypothetical protein AAGL98_11855, partial [Planctomycetota bacterium]